MADLYLGRVFAVADLDVAGVRKGVATAKSQFALLDAASKKNEANRIKEFQTLHSAVLKTIQLSSQLQKAGLGSSEAQKALSNATKDLSTALNANRVDAVEVAKAQANLASASALAKQALVGTSTSAKAYTINLNKLNGASIRVGNEQAKIRRTLGAKKGSAGANAISELNKAYKALDTSLNKTGQTAEGAEEAYRKFARSLSVVQNKVKDVQQELRGTGKGKAGAATAGLATINPNTAVTAENRIRGLNQRIGFGIGSDAGTDGAKLIATNNVALNKYLTTLRKVGLTTKEAQKAQAAFNATVGKSTRGFRAIKDGGNEAATGVSNMTLRMRNMTSAATLAVGPLSGIGARITAFAAIAQRSSLLIAGMIAGVTGLGLSIVLLAKGAITTGKILEDVRVRLASLTEYTYAATLQFRRLVDLASKTGLEFAGLAKQSTLLTAASRGTTIEGKQTLQIIEDLAFAAGRFKLSTKQVNSVILAFTQILSKGRVQAEEITGQLAEVLPGAFGIAARSIGVTTRKFAEMLRAGEVIAEDFLPKFAAEVRKTFGADTVQHIDSMTAAQNRLANSQTFFFNNFDRQVNVTGAYGRALNALTSIITFAANNVDALTVATGASTGAFLLFVSPGIIKGLITIVGWIRRATVAMYVFNAAVSANPLRRLAAIALALSGAAIGGALAASSLKGVSSALKELSDATDEYFDGARNPTLINIEHLEDQLAGYNKLLKEFEGNKIDATTGKSFFDLGGFFSGIAVQTGLLTEAQIKYLNFAKKNKQVDEEHLLVIKNHAAVTAEIARLRALITTQENERLAKARGELDYDLQLLRDKIAAQLALKKAITDVVVAETGGSTLLAKQLKLENTLIDVKARKLKQLKKDGLNDDDAEAEASRYIEVYREYKFTELNANESIKSLADAEKALGDVNKQLTTLEQRNKDLSSLALFEDINAADSARKIVAEIEAALTTLEIEDAAIQSITSSLTNALDGLPAAIKENKGIEKANKLINESFSKVGEELEFLSRFKKSNLTVGYDAALEVQALADAYIELGYAPEQAIFKVEQYRKQVAQANIETERLKSIGAAFDDIRDSFDNAFNDITKTLTEAIVQWNVHLISFKNLSQNVASAVVSSFLKLAVINPIIDNLFNGNGQNFFADFGQQIAGLFQGATGNAFGVKRPKGISFANPLAPYTGQSSLDKPFARGGIINSPQRFAMAGNQTGIAGESGAEAILPLMRDAQGNLGVSSSGSQGMTIVNNFHFPPGTDVNSFRRSQSQIEAQMRNSVQRGARNG